MSLTVAALVPVVAAELEAVSRSAGKLTRAVKEEPPAQARGSVPIGLGKLGHRSEISPA